MLGMPGVSTVTPQVGQPSTHVRQPSSIYETSSTQPAFNSSTTATNRSTNNNSPRVPPRPTQSSSTANLSTPSSNKQPSAVLDDSTVPSFNETKIQDKLKQLDSDSTTSSNNNKNNNTSPASTPSQHADNLLFYQDALTVALADKKMSSEEDRLLAKLRMKMNISDSEHINTLQAIGWSVEEYNHAKSLANTAPDDGRECVICLDQVSNHVILDCGHICLCDDCAKSWTQPTCPKCREPVRLIKKIYF